MTARTEEGGLRLLAAQQHGVTSRAQAASVGLDRHQIARLVRSGRWRPLGRQGLELVGTPPTDLHACAVALHTLGRGATLSHDTAAAYWGLNRFRTRPVHLLVPHGRNPLKRPGIVVHQARRLPTHHIVEIEGLRVTSPPRTIFDLSGTLGWRPRVEDVVDDAWAGRLISFESMIAVIEDLSGRGQRNIAELRSMVLARGPDHAAGETSLERRFHRIVREAGLPPMTPQVNLSDEEGWWGRCDAVYADARIIVEIDGDRWHTAMRHRASDERRRRRWAEMDYLVISFSEHEVWHQRDHVVGVLRKARRERIGKRRIA
jgi:hypothetical protein